MTWARVEGMRCEEVNEFYFFWKEKKINRLLTMDERKKLLTTRV